MGKIRKTAGHKHEITLCPYIRDHIKVVLDAPIHHLPAVLAKFPRPWPFQRGDLYHWIPVLNRFDDILQSFNSTYELDKGPQCVVFSRQFILSGTAASDRTDDDTLTSEGLPHDADRVLIESLLDYTLLLYENCANRSLYASSAHLNNLLNTTSISILDVVLRLGYRLAQRYTQERLRMSSSNHLSNVMPNILAAHYQFDLQRLEGLAVPFVKSLHAPSTDESATVKDTAKGTVVTPVLADDVASLAKSRESDAQMMQEFGSTWITYLREGPSSSSDSPPDSPTPGSRGGSQDVGRRMTLLDVSAEELSRDGVTAVLQKHLPLLPSSAHFQLLCRLRAAAALSGTAETRRTLICIRLMAIANLASIYPESTLQSKIFAHEADQIRRSHMPYQLCDLLHPAGKDSVAMPIELQTAALRVLESFSNHRGKLGETINAIGYNVNHGVLTYLVRKAVDDLEKDSQQHTTIEQTAWFASLFDVLHSLPKAISRVGDAFSAAGLLDSFVQALRVKSFKADEHRYRFLNFLDVFVYNTREAFNTFVTAGGLDALSGLLQSEVDASLRGAPSNNGLPAEWKAASTYSKINFIQQQTLRALFKMLKNMIAINGGPFDRLLRNLIESAQLLGGLKTVIEHPPIYGSNVWCGALEIFTNFIHNEPTSYNAIAEAGLTKAFLDSVVLSTDATTDRYGLLPTTEVLATVPLAFGAICLNENGMKAFTESNALDRFFTTLLHLSCTKSFTNDLQDQEQLGAAFDELARHHPSLKPAILGNVKDLISKLRDILSRSQYHGSLDIADASNNIVPEFPTHAVSEDVQMGNATESPEDSSFFTEKATTTQIVHSNVGLLQGLFHNPALCTPFAELGGLQALLDIASVPVLHSDQVLYFASGPLTKTLQIFVQQKPHLMIPLLLDRLRDAVAELSVFADANPGEAVLTPYIQSSELSSLQSRQDAIRGTVVMTKLVTIRNLIQILTKSFSEISHRNSHPVSSVNMTDVYVELVDNLGKLQSRCICEYMLLQDVAPASEAGSKIKGSALDAAQDQRANYLSKTDQAPQAALVPDEPVNPANQPQATEQDGESNELSRAAAKRNFKTISSILSRFPTDVAWFFSAIGRSILLSRRVASSSDSYSKQCAFTVASSIAQAIVKVLDRDLPDTMTPKLIDYYHRSTIACTSISMVEKSREAGLMPLTLILWKFKQEGGFEVLSKIGRVLLSHAELGGYGDSPEAKARGPTWATETLRNLTVFLGRATSNKEINDAQQTVTLVQSTRDTSRSSRDHFSSGQFLVELRMQVLKFIAPIWSSDAIANLHPEFVKALCSILHLILHADQETGAVSRKDKVPVASRPERRYMSLPPGDTMQSLKSLFAADLAEEAMFRCNNTKVSAQEYCELRKRFPELPRFAIPASDVNPEVDRRPQLESSTETQESRANVPSDAQTVSPAEDPQEVLRRIIQSNVPIAQSASHSADANGSEAPQAPVQETTQKASETSITTIEDLDELRSEVRDDLVDRSLVVLHKFDKLSFNIADLIMAGTSKASDPMSMRRDISETLVNSLISYQGSDEIQEASTKIAACAHVIGVTLQDKHWFEAARDSLSDNFDGLGQFLSQVPSDSSTDISWLANILLVLERLLSEELQPTQIQWIAPNPDEPGSDRVQEDKVIESLKPRIDLSEKKALFQRIVKLMPRVGKDTVLGTAIARILVGLTRNGDIAKDLSDRRNLQRLFVMFKQLSTVTDKKFKGTVMIILRQMVEDTAIVRQIMESEIRAHFDKNTRGTDTTIYTRQLFHLALRDPDMFVEVTNELLMLPQFDRGQAPQQLILKSSVASTETIQEESTTTSAEANPSVADTIEKDKKDDPKAAEVKAPLLDRTDGVTNFLLSELMAYREVKDIQPKSSDAENPKSSEDVEMTDSESSPSEPADAANFQPAKPEQKQPYKADGHPIFVYRSFLLQSLVELLQSYNCCKMHFINYSRKAEPQANTPSKPRAGLLYYLLNTLIPTGSLQHSMDDESKMTALVSSWATSVIVALCSKTSEKYEVKRRDGSSHDEEPVLVHVRKFVLEHTLKAFKETNITDNPELGYARLLNIADLFNKMLAGKPDPGSRVRPHSHPEDNLVPSNKQVARIMFEKNYIPALTASLSDVDKNVPGASRAVKHILRPLKLLTHTAIELSLSGEASSASEPGQSTDEDEMSSATSVSERGDGREETPDLFRNSTLGMFEPGREDDMSESSGDDEEDEDVYADDMDYEGGAYDDELDPEDGPVSDEDMDEEMGPIEGVDGDMPMDVEISLEHDHDHDRDDDDDDSIDDDDDEMDSDDSDDDADGDMVEVEEISGDDENASLAEGEEAGEWEDDDDEEAADYPGMPPPPMDALRQLLDAPADEDDAGPLMMGGADLGGLEDHSDFIDDHLEDPRSAHMPMEDGEVMAPFNGELGGPQDHDDDDEPSDEDEEEDPDEDEDMEEEEMGYNFDDMDDDDGEMAPPFHFGWEFGGPRRHHHHTPRHLPVPHLVGAERLFSAPGFRSHRHPGQPRTIDEDANPLLNRQRRSTDDRAASAPGSRNHIDFSGPPNLMARLEREILNYGSLGGLERGLESALMNLIQGPGGIPLRPDSDTVQLTMGGPGVVGDRRSFYLDMHQHHHGRPHSHLSHGRDDPASAIGFDAASTSDRWQECARLLYSARFLEKSQMLVNSILKRLVPPAIERDRERKRVLQEEAKKLEEKRAKDKAEREEREAREKKEAEERRVKEAEERAQAEADAAEAAARERAERGEDEAAEAMDVSDDEPSHEAANPTPAADAGESQAPREPVMVSIRGREIDISDLGIDMTYLDALPEEMREEVIMQQYAERRSTAAASGEEPTAINQEFLDALPTEIRAELLQQESRDRRRREREEQRQRQQAEGGGAAAPTQPDEIDAASFIASLDPILRQQVLAEAGDDTLEALPPDLVAEARALGGHHARSRLPTAFLGGNDGPSYLFGGPPSRRPLGERDNRQDKTAQGKTQRRPIIQMLDKSGVATLLRLMFIPVVGGSKSSLNAILTNACGNRQTRGEVLNGLLSILQDGCADVGAIERYFSQLTVRAKQPAAPKTPLSAKKPNLQLASSIEASPHLVVGQCLSSLHHLADTIPTIPIFFLTEHEMIGNIKSKSSKKGKARETRTSKYPLVSLLALLERESVLENSTNMEQLSGLLAMVTRPLGDLLKKEKSQSQIGAKPASVEVAGPAVTSEEPQDEPMPNAPAQTASVSAPTAGEASQSEPTPGQSSEQAQSTGESSKEAEANKEAPKKHRTLTPPDIAPETLKPVVNILLARECSSSTFRNTITTGTNLSAIPGAKDIFKNELIEHARELAISIQSDLRDMTTQLQGAQTNVEAQSIAIAKFSPTGSEQSKLSRIITALDYFYDPDAKSGQEDAAEKNNELLELLENETFTALWHLLSDALEATKRPEGDFFMSVATMLLPLIEALLVICKRVSLKDKKSTVGPGLQMRSIFFAFTNRHKRILNELVRNNPRLMNANFSVLVKNSGVLEFDNKRNYFNRRLHHRSSEMRQYPSPSLQLNVSRENVFLDSYKSLSFKKAEEIKYGKLNIRFHHEEGVDAGGVTREWFQVLARKMFNADYALFNPVASDRTTFHPNALSAINPEHLAFFKFIGRIIGKALYENRVLDCHFSRAVYKKILGQAVSMKDMETVDLDYSKNMQWMLNNDITDILTETFSISQDNFGVEQIIDLIPNGRNVAVTDENKHEFVRKVIEHRLTGSVQEQLDSFLQGFYDIVSPELIAIFDEGELELLISGMPDIDVDDWKANTDYHNYNASSPQIQWFWRAVRSFDKEERAKLLQFVTGTGKVPLNGFKELEGMNGFTRFTIHKDFNSKDRLPSSHTCFNQLDLPEYDNYEVLRKSLYTAMTTGNEYFGFA